MKLLSVGLARSIWLFDVNELNPAGKSIFPDAFLWLGEKYSFESFPKAIGDLDPAKKGFLFKTGKFQTDEGAITVNFSIFSDGLVAETWASTEKGDAFIDELLRSTASQYGLTRPTAIRKQYVSEMTVRLDHSLSSATPGADALCKALDRLFERHHLPSYELSGMSFSFDVSQSSYKPPGLIIERKLGVDFSQHHFWSKSPFPTKDHLFALEEFEKLLAAGERKEAAVEPEFKRAIRLDD
jgi:hypothetical protein